VSEDVAAVTDQNMIRWEKDADGVVILTLDDPNQSANTMNELYTSSMAATLDRLEAEKESITGVVITSAKKTFFAGGDLRLLIQATKADTARVRENVTRIKSQLRRLEQLGRPVVAAVNGSALGGGFEITLACHHRVVADDSSIRIGFPEVTLGLLPGAGGVVRTVRLMGIADALLKLLVQGQQVRPAEALEMGVVHEVVARDELIPAAKRWIAANPGAVQPYDVKGYRIPGGTPATPSLAAMLPSFPANLRKELKGAPYPAPHHILCAAVEGAQVDFDNAMTIETRYFVDLVTGQTSKNMIQAFWFDLQSINNGGARPAGVPTSKATRVAVLGAGMMGAGIAYVCARRGMDVVLKDVSLEAAEKGRDYSVKLLDKAVTRGRMTPTARDEVLARITPTADPADTAGCDLVIEAVFESRDLKHRVFQEVEDLVAPGALLCSNTSTLPITDLATAVTRQEDFVGLHFFSPVDKMPLVEIIRGRRTSDEALARAFDVVLQIGKTPIVVNDSRGFFTSRVIGTFINEALAMLGEGINPVSIERAATQAGYPVGPLQLMDELTLTLPQKLRNEARAALEAAGGTYAAHPAEAVVDRMVDLGRKGRSTGGGFYDYSESGERTVWPGLYQHFSPNGASLPFDDMKERMLFAEALETVKCFDEGVITSAADANIGSIMGIGFPAWSGGVVQYMVGYAGGLAGFVRRAQELEARYGQRFTPPPLLLATAERGGDFRSSESPPSTL
jgi:3-hydroxyacyl-CoA dehydrogenase / enoyl-CoA hydratase / 3-hydroxybutyryl-CoA epimerase